MNYCYFASVVHSSLDVYYRINFMFFFTSFYVACAFVICLLKYLLTYLLTGNKYTENYVKF